MIRAFEVAYFAASIDSAASNRRFAESLELDFPILSDPGKSVARSFGVLRALGLYAARQTFYIGADGEILFVDRNVQTRSAGQDMAAKLADLDVPRRS